MTREKRNENSVLQKTNLQMTAVEVQMLAHMREPQWILRCRVIAGTVSHGTEKNEKSQKSHSGSMLRRLTSNRDMRLPRAKADLLMIVARWLTLAADGARERP